MDSKSDKPSIIDTTSTFKFVNVGMLGVVISEDMLKFPDYIRDLQIRMIESRILRIEEFIKKTGFDINSIDLSNISG